MAEEKEKTEEEKAQEAAQEEFNKKMSAIGAPPGPGFPAARIGDPHLCPMIDVLKPHVGGPIATGFPKVLIGGQPAARVGDVVTCAGPPDAIMKGSTKVLIGGQPAARMLDQTVHGGAIIAGYPTVLIA